MFTGLSVVEMQSFLSPGIARGFSEQMILCDDRNIDGGAMSE